MTRWAPLLLLAACSNNEAPDFLAILTNDSGVPDAGEVDAGLPPPPDAGARRICPPDGGWVSLAPLPAGPRAEVGVAELHGEIYVAGGYDEQDYVVGTVEVYSYLTNSWRTAAPLPRILNHVNLASFGDKLYALGALNQGFAAVPYSWVYDPATDAWTPIANMPMGTERGAAALAVVGSRIIVAGGYRAGSVRDVSAYDPAADTWTMLPPLPVARDHLTAATFNGVFYAIGGRRNGYINGRVDALDAQGTAWSDKAAMMTARAGSAAATVGGGVIVMGGEGALGQPGNVFAEVERYDFATDSWSSVPHAPTSRHGTGGATIDGVAFFPGGAIQEGTGPTAVNEAFCP